MINVAWSRTLGSVDGEARTCNLSISSQALYHWATALPQSTGKVTGWWPFVNVPMDLLGNQVIEPATVLPTKSDIDIMSWAYVNL